jgi:hypothetical protein
MSKARHDARSGLEVIADTVKTDSGKGPAPVHLWNPPYCGDIDMRIAADGTWFYQGTPIGRPALVRLFAAVLKREGEKYFLVTPVEKCGIVVEDAPFMAVEMQVAEMRGTDPGTTTDPDTTADLSTTTAPATGRELCFRTNVDDWVVCGPGHPLRFETDAATGGLKPYLHVRSDLWAKVTRAVWYDLVELGETREIDGTEMFGVASGGEFYAMAPASSLEDLGL